MAYKVAIEFAVEADTPEKAAQYVADGLKHAQYSKLGFTVYDNQGHSEDVHFIDVDMKEI